jgi:hypothetical protein
VLVPVLAALRVQTAALWAWVPPGCSGAKACHQDRLENLALVPLPYQEALGPRVEEIPCLEAYHPVCPPGAASCLRVQGSCLPGGGSQGLDDPCQCPHCHPVGSVAIPDD